MGHYTGMCPSSYVLHVLQNQEFLMLFIHWKNVLYNSTHSSSLMMGQQWHNDDKRMPAPVSCKAMKPICMYWVHNFSSVCLSSDSEAVHLILHTRNWSLWWLEAESCLLMNLTVFRRLEVLTATECHEEPKWCIRLYWPQNNTSVIKWRMTEAHIKCQMKSLKRTDY
jgi:hypothetical protein